MYVSIMGDSISTYEGFIPEGYAVFYDESACARNGLESVHDTWWMQVLEALGADLLTNDSYSGSQVTGDEFPCASSPQRTGALAGIPSTSKTAKAIESPAKAAIGNTEANAGSLVSPDPVFIYIGVNDFGFAVPCDREYAASPDEPTFRDAYLTMVRRIQNNYPQARIVCGTLLTPRMAQDPAWSFDEKWRGFTPLSEFNARIRSAATEAGALVADLANRACGERYDTLDGLHPNREGHRQIARLWTEELERLGIGR